MKEMSIPARLYILFIYLLGAFFFSWNLLNWQPKELVMLVSLCFLASLALIIKVEGATNRSHYAFSFILYGFSFYYLGIPETAIVIFVSNLVEFLVNRPAWFGPVFNTACYVIVINIAGFVFQLFNPDNTLATPIDMLAITVSMVVFTVLNHFMVGIVVWLANGENFRESGIFDPLPLILDLTLLILGGMLVLIWDYNPYGLLLFLFPIYLIYSTLRVPALERQTEKDVKTGLFNHPYFMQHLESELKRANRFDRPLTVIMADLDLLRNINNMYGHLAGDEVLIGIAKIMKQSVRDYDIVSRFGGEEFAVLMPETTLSKGYERAEAIRKAVEAAEFIVPTSITPIKATLSLGVACRESFEQSSQEIIHNADTALYHSKLKGRNRAFAYAKDAYLDFLQDEMERSVLLETPTDNIALETYPFDPVEFSAATERITQPATLLKNLEEKVEPEPSKQENSKSKQSVYFYIGSLFVLSFLSFVSLYVFTPNLFLNLTPVSVLGIAGCAILVVVTEWFSIDLYTKKMSLSTSAVPILAGTLLFGPIASLVLSLTYAITTSIKYHSPFNRLVFNFSNQLLVGILYTTLIAFTGKLFIELSTIVQLGIALGAAMIVYLVNTVLISIGVAIDTGEPVYEFWRQHYSWLFTIYIGMGIVAAAFVFGYKHDPLMGSLLVIVPLLLLRVSQVQYVERTRAMVTELREKNTILEKYSDEILNLNNGLLDTLSEVIDLRDPYVLGHSRAVTEFAMLIARKMGLHERQVEIIRKGSLLHDLGKLGISQDILAKPNRLTALEFETIKRHPKLGAAILEKSPHLRSLIPVVRFHHERYDGGGYPDGIAGNQIPIEARIVSVADAVEAMSTNRPYRKARSKEYIIDELQKCSGEQFDPLVVDIAIKVLNDTSVKKEVSNAKGLIVNPENSSFQV